MFCRKFYIITRASIMDNNSGVKQKKNTLEHDVLPLAFTNPLMIRSPWLSLFEERATKTTQLRAQDGIAGMLTLVCMWFACSVTQRRPCYRSLTKAWPVSTGTRSLCSQGCRKHGRHAQSGPFVRKQVTALGGSATNSGQAQLPTNLKLTDVRLTMINTYGNLKGTLLNS